jgi:peptidoglycan hydrolase-like protein with peptidoglycan-binding domain
VRSASIVAVAASAVVGAACGVGGGLLIGNGTTHSDPLGVGVPFVNQPCQPRESLLVVGMGDARPAIAAAVTDQQGSGVRYLATRDSCTTAWNRAGHPASRYVVYQGPFSTRQACEQRMTEGIQGHLVTQLAKGNTEPVQCLCYISRTQMPVLRPTPDRTTSDTIFIRALQDLLVHLGRNLPGHVNGVYDLQTQAQVKVFQHQNNLLANGDVNADTWTRLRQLGCPHYKS